MASQTWLVWSLPKAARVVAQCTRVSLLASKLQTGMGMHIAQIWSFQDVSCGLSTAWQSLGQRHELAEIDVEQVLA